jgi:hypothetical protein
MVFAVGYALGLLLLGGQSALAAEITVTTDGAQNQTGAFSYVPNSPPATVQLIVQSPDRSRATTVPFTVTDGCGTWPTFVGGGAGSF